MNEYPNQLSAAITWLRFPLIFMVITLHGYSVVQLPGNHSTFFHSVYPFALWFGETGVPVFFFISGFLFFLSHKTYLEKIKARCHSLLIPYILWNALLLFAYIVAFVVGNPQDINGKNMSDFMWTDYLRLFWDRGSYDNGNFVPLLCPFWYIRNLLILSLISPMIYIMNRYLRECYLLAVIIWWILTPHNAFIPQSILFFSLGAFFSIQDKNPLSLFIQHKTLFISLCLLLAGADIITHTAFPTAINLQIHRFALIANIPALFLLAYHFTAKSTLSSVASYLSNSAFIVFSIHYPIVVVLRKGCIQLFSSSSDFIQIILYFVCIIITTLISLLFYQVLPTKIKNILSGNRA
ncbi:acyltransferase [Prevotella communis]|uniref:acyltransferase family protein n=1 Tax=Prevotella communis TaxID=2913614 RepID=UPI001EDAE093|nr:acyltransferase [Prevotella communis]UKK68973.1 acyltransferase [Prevotella communis]UKK71552.1 acyltransferase [Prevotella communis]